MKTLMWVIAVAIFLMPKLSFGQVQPRVYNFGDQFQKKEENPSLSCKGIIDLTHLTICCANASNFCKSGSYNLCMNLLGCEGFDEIFQPAASPKQNDLKK